MTTSSPPSFIQPSISVSDSLLIALFIAVVIHTFILLGINFSIPHPPKVNKQIEITLANTPAKKAPKNAKFLAQSNQIGAGNNTKKPTPPKQKLASQGNSQNKPPSVRKNQLESKPKAKQRLITQQQAKQKIATTKKQTPTSAIKRPKLSTEALQQQIAQLGAKIRHSQQSSEKTKIKFVNSVSTHKYLAAQYVADWNKKLKRLATLIILRLPEKKGFPVL